MRSTTARARDLSGSRVLVTGAARGLGSELATVLAARGAQVSLVGLEPELLQARAQELGSGHTWCYADVTDQASIEKAVTDTVAELGGLDVVVTNAGVAYPGTLAASPIDAHVRTIDVNVNGTLRTLSASLPHLIESRGYALLIASVGSFSMFPGLGTYCTSKAAVEHLANALRFELAHTGVSIGSAHPAFLNTDLVRGGDDQSAAIRGARQRLQGPLGRTYSPTDCAAALAEGIASRSRRVYFPKSLAVMQALRSVTLSPIGDAILARQLRSRRYIPELEAELRAAATVEPATSLGLHTSALPELPDAQPWMRDRIHDHDTAGRPT